VEEGIGKGIIKMLILAIPNIFTSTWEPEVNDRLVMNVDIDLKTIREYMMSVVLVTPPLSTESKKELAKDFI
jgi:hypothetical protein